MEIETTRNSEIQLQVVLLPELSLAFLEVQISWLRVSMLTGILSLEADLASTFPDTKSSCVSLPASST